MIVTLKLLPSCELGLAQVLIGKREEPMSRPWAELDWKESLEKLGIPHRNLYACSESIAGHLVNSVAKMKRTTVPDKD